MKTDVLEALTSQSSQHFPPSWSHCTDVSVGSTDGSPINKGKCVGVCVWGGGFVWLLLMMSRLTNGLGSRLVLALLMKNFRSPEANLVPLASLWRLTISLRSEGVRQADSPPTLSLKRCFNTQLQIRFE